MTSPKNGVQYVHIRKGRVSGCWSSTAQKSLKDRQAGTLTGSHELQRENEHPPPPMGQALTCSILFNPDNIHFEEEEREAQGVKNPAYGHTGYGMITNIY